MSDVIRPTSALSRLLAFWPARDSRCRLRQLEPGAVWLPRRRGRLEVRCGRVWVTFVGDRQDYVLGPGDSITLKDKPHLVVQALGGPACVQIKEH